MLHVVLWDMHAARTLRDRLLAAGVAPQAVAVRGRRCEDGLQEAQVRPRRRMTTRWRMNAAVVVAAALIVGLPIGASLGTLLLGEQVWAATAGALLGGLGLGALGLYAVWGDHVQRFAGSRNSSRVEGHLAVTGDTAVVRAELLLAADEDVRQVTRLPPGSDPLGW